MTKNDSVKMWIRKNAKKKLKKIAADEDTSVMNVVDNLVDDYEEGKVRRRTKRRKINGFDFGF